MSGQWQPIVNRSRLCGYVKHTPGIGWWSACDADAIFVRADDDGMPEYSCAGHTAAIEASR